MLLRNYYLKQVIREPLKELFTNSGHIKFLMRSLKHIKKLLRFATCGFFGEVVKRPINAENIYERSFFRLLIRVMMNYFFLFF